MIWAVLDTNVLVSGLGWSGGLPARILDEALAGRFLLVTNPPLLSELRRVLAYPKLRRAFPDPEAILGLLEEVAVVVTPELQFSVLADEADNRVLEAALEARADAIVTGDRHLLALGAEYERVRLLRPRAFLRLLAG